MDHSFPFYWLDVCDCSSDGEENVGGLELSHLECL